MNYERVTSTAAEQVLLAHESQETDECLICRALRDLLDARKQLEDKQEALVAAWAEIKRLRQYEPLEYTPAR
jgi:hypothetical protein